jgi:N-acetylglutamate synthase-like GNAT family acetyltransferase
VTAATGAIPAVVGKPHRPLFEAAAERTGAARPLVIGDRLDTDVDGAGAMGWDSLLVLTGASGLSDLIHARHGPTFVAGTLRVLGEDVPPARFRSAEAADTSGIRALLEESGLSSEGLEDRLPGTMVSASPGSGVDATSCLEIVDGHGLVRSVAVRPGARGHGLGALAVAASARVARSVGVRHLTLFTRTTSGFYGRLGFRAAALDALPAPVMDSRQAREECAGSAMAMVAELRDSPPGAAQP